MLRSSYPGVQGAQAGRKERGHQLVSLHSLRLPEGWSWGSGRSVIKSTFCPGDDLSTLVSFWAGYHWALRAGNMPARAGTSGPWVRVGNSLDRIWKEGPWTHYHRGLDPDLAGGFTSTLPVI